MTDLLQVWPRKDRVLIDAPAALDALPVVVKDALVRRHELHHVIKGPVQLALAAEHGVVELHNEDTLGEVAAPQGA
ncbi:hypothetical protein V502_04257 [Pseudogymnoascus sp. VKM F-4520 (FW-2644)]|nr:hypothetical protein V502_04257 [Pseudogymnoascus sp. VKM F-4520 (FW-2644)]